MVTWENYEEYMLLYADRELSDVQQQQLMEFVALHPELQQELDMYDATRMVPDTDVVYTDKESLLQPLPVKRSISLRQIWVYSAAACVLLLASIGIFKWGENAGTQQANIAHVSSPIKTTVRIDTPQQRNIATVQTKETTVIAEQQTATHHTPSQKQYNTHPVTPTITQKAIAHEPVLVKNETIEKLNSIAVQQQTATIVADEHIAQPIQVATISQPEVIIPSTKTINKKHSNDLLARLPFGKERKKGLNDLKNAVANGVQQVRTASNNLKDADLRLKIGNKDVLVVKL